MVKQAVTLCGMALLFVWNSAGGGSLMADARDRTETFFGGICMRSPTLRLTLMGTDKEGGKIQSIGRWLLRQGYAGA